MPFAEIPRDRWNAIVADRVPLPKMPSTDSRWPYLLSCTWAALTVDPRLPYCTLEIGLPHVFCPTTPSAASPRERWKLTTRDLVPLPKIPSAPVEYPRAVSRCCTVVTLAPVFPCRASGQLAALASVAIEVTASMTTTACRTDLAMVMGA